MAQDVRCHGLGRQRGTAAGCGADATSDKDGDAVAVERAASTTGEDSVVGSSAPFRQPDAEHGAHLGGAGCDAFLAALAVAAEVCTGAEFDAAALEGGELGDA